MRAATWIGVLLDLGGLALLFATASWRCLFAPGRAPAFPRLFLARRTA